MKIKCLFFLIFFLCLSCGSRDMQNKDMSSEPNGGEKIGWVYDLSNGLEQAQSLNKPLMVDFYADWCGWCKKLDRDVYSKDDIQKLLESFIAVKVNTDRYPQDARKNNVQGLPTVLFMSPDGKIIAEVIGYKDSAAFKEIMTKIIKQNDGI